MKKEIVTIEMDHVCPMVSGTTPHIGGPIIGPGSSAILIDGKPIALLGDTCVCYGGPPDTIVEGYPSILVDGVPIVVQGCMTAHGGTIPAGVPGITVSSATPLEPLTMHFNKIPFPEIRKVDRMGAAASGHSESLQTAVANQDALRHQAKEAVPAIYNVHWEKEEVLTDEGFIRRKITLVADTSGYEDGETVTFTISPKDIDPDFGRQPDEKQVEGTVKDGRVCAEWLVEV